MSVDLFECIALGEGATTGLPRVDREKGLIYNVKCLGWKSLNGREYDPAGVDPKLYEGRKVCVDHARPGAGRSSRDTIGVLEGATKTATGIYAKQLRLLHPAGEFEQRLMTAAESAPHLFGLSHTAKGREKLGSRGGVIEAVEKVNTVDVVDDPATVSSLYESKGVFVKVKLSALVESLKTTRPKYARLLSEMAEAGILAPDAPMDEPPDEEPAGGDHKAAIRDACKAILDDESLSEEDMVKKIKALLKIAKGGAGDESDESDEPTEESIKLAKLEAKDRLRTAADDAGVRLPKTLLESIRPGITVEECKALVVELKGAAGVSRGQAPRSATPVPPKPRAGTATVAESREKPPEGADAKATAKWLTSK